MIALPWQVVVAFIALFGLQMLLGHLRRVDCNELVRAEKNQQHRDTMAIYRNAYTLAWKHATRDFKRLTQDDEVEPKDD